MNYDDEIGCYGVVKSHTIHVIQITVLFFNDSSLEKTKNKENLTADFLA